MIISNVDQSDIPPINISDLSSEVSDISHVKIASGVNNAQIIQQGQGDFSIKCTSQGYYAYDPNENGPYESCTNNGDGSYTLSGAAGSKTIQMQ